MKAVLTTLGKFHSFDLARQLHARGALEAIYSGYPRFKLGDEKLPDDAIRTFPYVHAPYMASGWRNRIGTRLLWEWEYWDRVTLDRHVAHRLRDADVFVGLSGCGLATGFRARERGIAYVCDRGSTHIRHQDEVMRAEYARWDVPFAGVDPRIIEREENEYALADAITVPSSHVRATFIERGVDPARVHVLPYGVDLTRFMPMNLPRPGRIDLLFVGGVNLRKGLPYLLAAFKALDHPAKSLTIAGIAEEAVLARMRERGLLGDDVTLLGHVPQPQLKELMSCSHALVLPSLEEGLALVMAQALACGCPVIATPQTGAADLFDDGVEGLIVAPGDAAALLDAMQRFIDEPGMRVRMSAAALDRVKQLGGWSRYGENAVALYDAVVRQRRH